MSNDILNSLLKEYDQKKLKAELECDERKNNLYRLIPRLQEIDNELNSFAFKTAKNILNNSLLSDNSNNSYTVENLEEKIKNLKKEKEKILNENNLTLDYLKPFYECKICNDTGYVLDNNYKTTMCNCLKQKLLNISFNKSNIYNIKNQNFQNFNELFYSDKIDESKYHSDVSPRENIKLIKDICFSFINNFEKAEEKNLLFTGNTGLGKTFLSSCIANELIKQRKTVLYQTAPVMLDTIIDYRFGKSNNSNILESILNVDLLIIDDLGTECVNNMKFTELFNIINTRLLNQKNITKTIISTNLSLQNLYNTYDERIVSRIIGDYNICYFFGEDIRFKKICD